MKLINMLALVSAVVVATNAFAAHTVQPIKAKAVHFERHSENKRFQQYIVQLSEQPELGLRSQLAQGTLSQPAIDSSLLAHKQKLVIQQSQLMTNIKSLHSDSKVKRNYTGIVNAMAVETSLSVKELKGLRGVSAVYPVQYYKVKLGNALPIIKASEAWQLVGGMSQAGKGIRIAVIDSGIVSDHPLFSDTGFTAPASLPSNDYCRTTEASFCNNKLIVARYYKPSFVDDSFGEFDSPKGLSGHGTHVAGIATGRQVTAPNGESFSGVAPGAYLMVYKALWGQEGEGTDVELLAALEDAVADGANVINNSWGGSNGQSPNASLYSSVFNQMEQNGIVLVSAAGNEGEDDEGNVVEKSIACPGCIEAGITVGATSTDLVNGVPVTFTGSTFYAKQSDAFNPNSAISGVPIIAPANNLLGCDAWENSLSGQIAVVSRGTCTFEVKANNAQQAGAVAMVVTNNVAGSTIVMSMGEASLPAVMLSMSDGTRLTADINQSPQTPLNIAASSVFASDVNSQDRMGRFSSLGPNGDDSFIKPDMSAPGVSILSGTSPDDSSTPNSSYAYLNGTSMATPMVAGAAAILKQANPSYNAIQVKNILVNASDSVVLNPSGSKKATAFETGAGRLNVLKALNMKTYASKPNMAKTPCVLNCQISNMLNLVGNEADTWAATVEFDNPEISAQVTPNQLSLTAEAPTQEFTVGVTVPTNSVTGWHFGRLKWTSQKGEELNQAIAINHTQGATSLLQAQVTDKNETTKSLSLQSKNISNDEKVTVKVDVSGGASFVDSSLFVTTVETVFFEKIEKKSIEVFADVERGRADISTGEAPVKVDLADTKIEPFVCDLAGNLDGCDDVLIKIAFDFEHFGESYTSLHVSDNGLVVAGDDVIPGNFSLNQNIPNSVRPNNVVAPFWTDFDLINVNRQGDSGGGEFIFGISEMDEKRYLIIQWNKAKLVTNEEKGINADYWGVSSTDIEFTFQLIIQENSDNKWFRYLSIPEQPNFYTVGFENQDSTIGASHWYNGAGVSAVNTDETLALQSSGSNSLSLTVDIEKEVTDKFSQDDSFSVTEDVASTLNVVANDAASAEDALLSISVAKAKYFEKIFSGDNDVSLDLSSLVITSTPNNGVAQVMDGGLIKYTPNSDFNGEDDLIYQITNSVGEQSVSTVKVMVQAVNDQPVIVKLEGPDSVDAGASATYSASATDVDGDDLTYQWTLPAEMSSSDLTSSTLVTAVNANLPSNKQVTVSVVVSDGNTSVSQEMAVSLNSVTQVTPPVTPTPPPATSSSGGSTGLVVFIGGFVLLLVRRQRQLLAPA